MRRGSPKLSCALAAPPGWVVACAVVCLSAAATVVGCKGKTDVSSRPAPAGTGPATPSTQARVDLPIEGPGFTGTLRLTTSLAAPLVVFLPKTYGSRRELTPFVERAEQLGLEAHTLVLEPPKLTLVAKPPGPGVLADDAIAPLVQATRAAIAAVDARVAGQPPLLLVGSDFGCTLAALVAKEEPRVRAAALVSPGPSLHGVDLYKPVASLAGKPLFVAGGDHDPVSAEPLGALSAMARDKATKKLYPGVAHGAGMLATSSPTLRDDLAQWLVATARDVAVPPADPSAAAGTVPVPSPGPKGTL